MYLQLIRPHKQDITRKFTKGKLFINGTFETSTIEDEDRFLEDSGTKEYGLTAIPRGKYNLKISYSNHFQRELISIQDVPNFEGVRIHSGNSSKDTAGCILVGIDAGDEKDWISSSRTAYTKLHKKVKEALERGELVTLEIV